MKTTTLYQAIKQEITWINDELDTDEQLTDKQINQATEMFLNGNYIWQLINDELINIMDETRKQNEK